MTGWLAGHHFLISIARSISHHDAALMAASSLAHSSAQHIIIEACPATNYTWVASLAISLLIDCSAVMICIHKHTTTLHPNITQ
jgi:ferredoxin-like protein FixX